MVAPNPALKANTQQGAQSSPESVAVSLTQAPDGRIVQAHRQTFRETLHETVSDEVRKNLQKAANERFLLLFQQSAPEELSRAAPQLTEPQRHQILQEASHLFQRPLDDMWMIKRMQEANLPADKVLADYHQRLDHLNTMTHATVRHAGDVIKRLGITLAMGVAGGVAALWGGNRLIKEYAPKLTKWVRYPGAIVGGGLGSLITMKLTNLVLPLDKEKQSAFAGHALDARSAEDGGFVAEIQRMTAMAYIKNRAAAICAGEENAMEGEKPIIAPRPAIETPVQPTAKPAQNWEKRLSQAAATDPTLSATRA